MANISIVEMKKFVKNSYGEKIKGRKVDEMNDKQILAFYYRLKRGGK